VPTRASGLEGGRFTVERMETSFSVVNSAAHLGPPGELGRATVRATGKHNVLNALASIGIGLGLGMPFEQIREGLLAYDGVERRMQVKANHGGVLVVEDYAHHPTEVAATLDAASHFGAARVVAIFQPHLYSRTKFFTNEFARALLPTDKLLITEIYKAREEPMPGVSGLNIVRAARELGHPDAEFVEEKGDLPDALEGELKEGDLVLVLGAGDIWRVADEIARRVRQRADQ